MLRPLSYNGEVRTLPAWLLILAAVLSAAEPQVICGTSRELAREEIFLHRRSMANRQKIGSLRAITGPVGVDIGNIAVMYDSGGVLARRNPFNLGGRGINFVPNGDGYAFETVAAVFDDGASTGGASLDGLGDDDTRRVDLPFPFRFYGVEYTGAFVNSDGNLSFVNGDASSQSKSVGLLSGGPPRIAPLFVDLDNTRPNSRGVRVYSDTSRFVVTWEVPEYGSGSRPVQLVQLRIFANGRIEFAYPSVAVTSAVVGITPGQSRGTTEIVSFAEGSANSFPATLAERFSGNNALDRVLLTQRFYQTHQDAYDYVAVYNTLGISPVNGTAVATESTVRNNGREGFGDLPVDLGFVYGSANRLQASLDMGPLSQYPRNPTALVPRRGSVGDTPLTVLAHETGHLWLALASVRDPNDAEERPMLTADLAHWSFYLNTDASFLGGNRIADNGAEARPRYSTTATVEQYSPLDQYLMGFRPAQEVPPTFYVTGPGLFGDDFPLRGVSFNGTRNNVTVDDIISAEGRRIPDHTVAQRNFRMAIVLLIPDGTEPVTTDLAQLETLREQFEAYFATVTGGRATMDTTLKRGLRLSTWPAAGVVAGAAIEASVLLDRPAESDLTVLLRAANGVAEVPASVLIPAGEMAATFDVRGQSGGVEAISAEPDDSRYMADTARVQVAPSADSLKLQALSGDEQTGDVGWPLPELVELRATDVNLLPYPGLTIHVEAAGTVEAINAVTGADGIARFRWTPGASGMNQLTAVIEGSSVSVTLSATAP